MHIAVYAVTDLRSLRSVIKALRKINRCPEVLEISYEAEERIFQDITNGKKCTGVVLGYDDQSESFFTVDDCRIMCKEPA